MLVACDLAGQSAEAEAAFSLPLGDGGAPSAGVQVVPLPRGCALEELADQPVLLSLEICKQIMCGVLEALQADWDARAAGPGRQGGGFSLEALGWLEAVRKELVQALPRTLWCGVQRAAAAVSSAAVAELASPGPVAVL
ncbi:hypothetical protein GPECTOR_21g726 [Gonium pectorale]|uniref:Uncharacterized protein n=1 Tax=Gonium pectorale TaxID=33097 RepID=A0A150GJ78_GONPE|nr:hypothetical protein GPECTOR_21g726 [Gonium pectorale]|eukprot:KXZ49500.1 hypothetical protein GPECTOR_21g726 [Gonium pectorale]